MCRSSATAILCSSSLVHVFIVTYFAKSLAIFLVTYFLHPLDRFSIQLFLNSNVRHAGSCRGSVPVFLTRRNPDNITFPDFLLSTTPLLNPAGVRCHDENLAQWVTVPCCAGAGLKRNATADPRAGDFAGKSGSMR